LQSINKEIDKLENLYKKTFDLINKKDISKIDNNKSRIFIFHNHHLAYYCWKKLFLDGKLGKNNLLLHFDAHRDIKVPNFKEINDFNEYQKVKNRIDFTKDYVLDKLWIDNYIFPAIKEGIVNEVLWIKPDNIKLGIGPKLLKKVYFDKKMDGFISKQGGVPIETIYLKDLKKSKKTILNIDLDYFSCSGLGGESLSKEKIVKKIDNMFFAFDRLDLKFEVITIALSPEYTPGSQIEFIEEKLKEKLKRIC